MPAHTEELIFAVNIQANVERIAQLNSILIDNRKELESLNKAFDANRITQAELAGGQARLGITAKNTQQEISVLTRAVQAQQVANSAAAGSVDELAAKSKILTLQVNALGAEQKKTAAGKELIAQLKATNDALKAAGAEVSDFRRNVGNYRGDMLAAAKDLNLFGVNVGQVGSNLSGKLTQGLDIAKKGFGSLKAAVASTGIGLLLVAFTSLFEYFKKTDEGAELLEAAFAGVGAIADTLSGVVISLGKGLVSAATDPKKAFDDLVGFLETNVANRFKAFGVLIEAIKTGNLKGLANGVIQLSTGITDGVDKARQLGQQIGAVATEAQRAAKAAFDLKQQQFALDDARRASVVTLEKERNQIDKLVLSARDRGQSEQQRLANLDKASALETKGLQTTTKLAQQKLDILLATNREAILTGKISDEQRDAAVQAEADLARLAGQSATLQQQIANRRSGVVEQLAAERKAEAAAVLERQRDTVRARQTSLELELLEVQKGSVAELLIKKKQVEAARDLELLGEKLTADQKKLIRAKAAVEIRDLERVFAEKLTQEERQRVEANAKEVQREYGEAQKNLEDYLSDKRAAAESAFAQGLIGEGEYQRQLAAINKAGLDAELVNAKDYGQKLGAIQKKIADNEIKENKRVKDEKKKIEDVKREIISNSVQAGLEASDLLINALGEETAAGQVALGIKKTLALAEIAINLEKVLSNNAETASQIAKEYPYVGPALAVAYEVAADAVAIAAAASSTAKILGFNTGGIVPGGQGTYDEVPAMLTKGEVVIGAGIQQYPQMLPVLSYLNTMVGGANFAPGFTPNAPRVPGQVDGGLMARQLGSGQVIDYDKLAAACANIPAPVVNPTHVVNAAAQRAVKISRFTIG